MKGIKDKAQAGQNKKAGQKGVTNADLDNGSTTPSKPTIPK